MRPLYDYDCLKCKVAFEIRVDYEKRDEQKCEKCGETLSRVEISSNTRFYEPSPRPAYVFSNGQRIPAPKREV